MNVELNGLEIRSERDFHRCLSIVLGVQGYYGNNLDAMWDLLSAGVERPLVLIWKDHHFSKKNMGKDFDDVIKVLNRVVGQDERFGWTDRFSYQLL